jgi:hypothetical protein
MHRGHKYHINDQVSRKEKGNYHEKKTQSKYHIIQT